MPVAKACLGNIPASVPSLGTVPLNMHPMTAIFIGGVVIAALAVLAASAERRYRWANAGWEAAEAAAKEADIRRTKADIARERAEQRAQEAEAAREEAERDPKVEFLPVERVWRKQAAGRITGRHAVALAVMDLDGFKEVNDAHGHAWGDFVLRIVAERMRETLPDALMARIGGDEFAILLPASPSFGFVLDRLAEPMSLQGRGTVRVRASFGVVGLLAEPDDLDERLHQADIAMLRAKKEGGGVRYWSVPRRRILAPGELART